MEIVLEKKDALNAKLKVSMTEADYKPKVAAKLKEYTKTAQLKGFRPGKVPTALIQKMYGKGVLVEEINNVLSNAVTEYIKSNNLSIIGDPLPEENPANAIDWENQTEFQFGYDLGLVPEFTYDLKTLKLNRYDIAIDDKAIATTLDNIKKQFGKSINPEVSEAGDALYCEITDPNGSTKSGLLYLERANKNHIAPFIGKKKEDVVEAKISSLFEEAHVLAHLLGLKTEEAAELHGKYSFKIININRNEDAEMNQELFDKTFGKDIVTDEADFRAKLQETIIENYKRESDLLLKSDIKQVAVEHIAIEFPNEFLKRWLLLTNQGKVTAEQIEQEYDMYLKELKWNLIKNKIAKDHGLTVEEVEIIEFTKNGLKRQFGNMEFTGEMEETLNKIVENQLKQDKGVNYMKAYEEILGEKVSALVSGQTKLTDKKITVEEFEKIVSA